MGVFGFFGFFGRLAPTLRAHRAPHLYGVQSAKVFCTLLERERACADRNDNVFSIVVFNVGDPDVNTDRVQHVARVLASRRRSTDEAGWLDDRSLGILLRYTSTAGACRLANDVCYAISSSAPPPKYTVYTYPDPSRSSCDWPRTPELVSHHPVSSPWRRRRCGGRHGHGKAYPGG